MFLLLAELSKYGKNMAEKWPIDEPTDKTRKLQAFETACSLLKAVFSEKNARLLCPCVTKGTATFDCRMYR